MQNAVFHPIYSMSKLIRLLQQQTPQQRHNPLNDYLFYKIMGEKGDEVQLLGFINAVLGKTGDDRFTSVEISIPRRRAAGYAV